jgi:biotin carboxyl carrier protein
MKMENLLTAAVDGVIETIPATVGGTLKRDEVILTLS